MSEEQNHIFLLPKATKHEKMEAAGKPRGKWVSLYLDAKSNKRLKISAKRARITKRDECELRIEHSLNSVRFLNENQVSNLELEENE